MSATPDKETVQAVVRDVLSRIGDQMGQTWGAIDDLLWDHHEPYHELSADEQKAWRAAFEAELNGGYEPAAIASATPHIYSEGEGPLEGRCSRCGLLLTTDVHLTRPRTTTIA